MKNRLALLIGFAAAATATPAAAREIVVHMKTSGAEGSMVFEPSFIKASPGDTVRFKPGDATHNAETMSNMIPAGATPIKGKMGQEIVLTVTKPGLYGIKCLPHYSMGMVALIQAGKPAAADIAAAKAVKLPPFAAKRMNVALAKVK